MVSILKLKNYRNLWFAQIVSELGDGITSLLIIYLASTLSDNPLVYSSVLMVRYLPSVLFGTLAGPIVDRFSKKYIMIAADLYRCLIVLAIILCQTSLPLIIFLTFLLGLGTVFFEPARSATIPRIIHKESIPEAVGLSQSTMMAMSIIAPSLGGILLLTKHYTSMLLFDSLTFFLSALILLTVHIPNDVTNQVNEENKQSYLNSLKEGLRILTTNTLLIGLFWLLIAGLLFVSMLNTNIYPLLLDEFKVGELHFGTLQTVVGVAGLLGSFVVTFFMRKIKARNLIIYTFLFIGLMCLLVNPVASLHESFPLIPIYAWFVCIGFTNTFINVPVNSLLLQTLPEKMVGRITGVMVSVINVSTLAGFYFGGLLAGKIGSIGAIMIAGIGFLIFGVIFPQTKYFKALRLSKLESEKGVIQVQDMQIQEATK